MATPPPSTVVIRSSSSSSFPRCNPQQFPLNTPITSASLGFAISLARRNCSFRRRAGARRWIVSSVSGGPSSSQYAKEMERVAAKEALLLAVTDAGGFKGFTSSRNNNPGSIEINEKILALERLNPTPRPTTSPMLEGLWEFQWAGAESPGSTVAGCFMNIIPSSLASVNRMNLRILDGSAKSSASIKIIGTIDMSFILVSSLTVEGPVRLKEEYVEGLLTTPDIPEDSIPSQLKSLYDQVISAVQRFPDTIRETLSGGLKVPLDRTYERQLLISYLDDEILIARNVYGAADVLSRTAENATASIEPAAEYIS